MIERSKGENKNNGIIIDYQNHSTDTEVYFKITVKNGYLSSSQWSSSEIDTIEKDFKLTTTKNTSLTNIHLYDSKGTITKYDNVEDIMDEYYNIRLDLYKKRKQHQLDALQNELNLISAKCRFILDIINENLIINKQSKGSIIKQLEDKQYPSYIDGKYREYSVNKKSNYEYLLRLPIYSLTQEEIDKLIAEKDKLTEEHEDLTETSVEGIWKGEISNFKLAYGKLY